MFYDIFVNLCEQKKVSPNKACIEMGLSRSLAAKWKNTKSNPSLEVLKKIADYFDVSIDYLLGKENKKTPSSIDEKLDGVEFALFNGTKDLNETQKQDVLNFIEFLKSKEK